MVNWRRVAAVADCPPGSCREFVVAGRIVAVANVEGVFYALDGICPHQGGPLGRGQLAGCILTCPWHGWQFDVRTGQHGANPALRQPTIDVKQDGSDVLVDLD